MKTIKTLLIFSLSWIAPMAIYSQSGFQVIEKAQEKFEKGDYKGTLKLSPPFK